MDLTRLLEITLSSQKDDKDGLRFDETCCASICQHPSCWASQRRQEKGVPRLLPPEDDDSDSSSDELNLPKQSICNLLGDYGDSTTDRYPLSTGGRPSHMYDTPLLPSKRTSRSLDNGYQLGVSPEARRKHDKSGLVRNSRLRLVEVQEVFDRDDLNSQWDETFVTKPYYMWVPNPKKRRKRPPPSMNPQLRAPPNTVSETSQPILLKDLTACMVPPEVKHQREETILKKQQRSRSPPSRPIQNFQLLKDNVAPSNVAIDTEGLHVRKLKVQWKLNVNQLSINELLALPKEALMKVLEQTKKSDFTTKGRIHNIVQESTRYDEKAQMALTAKELFKQKRMRLHAEPCWGSPNPPIPRPVYQMDDDEVLDRMSLVNTPVKDKDMYSEADTMESFPRFKKPLPGIQPDLNKPHRSAPLSSAFRAKIPSISLGLPELPSGVRTTRPFSYKRQDLDFSLGPVFSGQSSVRSSISGDFSDHGTTVKVNAPSSAVDEQGEAIHSVSPALSTHVPMAPVGTPATFQSPTKSAPVVREVTKDTAHLTMNTSERALPPSREVGLEETFFFSPSQVVQGYIMPPMETKLSLNVDEVLNTITETARENKDSSVQSSRLGAGEKTLVTPTEPAVLEEEGRHPSLHLETSHHRSIDTGLSPRAKSAKSIESCPSPEQWPLISESSFEKLAPRPSVSEPALSGRSDRHRSSRSRDSSPGRGLERDYARKVMDEKRKAESPAPPPPSPEPKDPSEKAENQKRKDLKSRDSLTMTPLFEVSELEEGFPTKCFREDDFGYSKANGRQETTRTIEITVPVAKSEGDENKRPNDDTEEEQEVDNGELVSQITVLNVTPKGRIPGRGPKDKVQETFLNVDIPAEEISSLKVEHGSCHQEDISSNGTAWKSHSTTTTGSEASLTPKVHGKVESPEEDGSSKLPMVSEDDDKQVEPESNLSGSNVAGASHLDIKQSQPAEEVIEDQGVLASEGSSGMSPEMLCDSARFISHEMVSPDKDELEGESSLVELTESNLINETGKTDETNEELDLPESSKEGQEATKGSTDSVLEGEAAPPGSFFLRILSTEEDKQDAEDHGDSQTQKAESQEETTVSDEAEKSSDTLQQNDTDSSQKDEDKENIDKEVQDSEVKPENTAESDLLDQSQEVTRNEDVHSEADTENEKAIVNESLQNTGKENESEETAPKTEELDRSEKSDTADKAEEINGRHETSNQITEITEEDATIMTSEIETKAQENTEEIRALSQADEASDSQTEEKELKEISDENQTEMEEKVDLPSNQKGKEGSEKTGPEELKSNDKFDETGNDETDEKTTDKDEEKTTSSEENQDLPPREDPIGSA